IADNNAFCPGESTILRALPSGGSQSYTYTWEGSLLTDDTLIVTPSATGYISVTINDGVSSITDSVLVSLYALPTVSAGVDFDICIGDGATITASGADTYIWDYNNQASTTINVTPTATTVYN